MRTWTATTTVDAPPDAVLHVLTDPDAIASWAPVDFEVSDLDSDRLAPGCRPRVEGRLGGVSVGFLVEVLAEATNALLSAGALQTALDRIGRSVAVATPVAA
jgi:hypothetical protein